MSVAQRRKRAISRPRPLSQRPSTWRCCHCPDYDDGARIGPFASRISCAVSMLMPVIVLLAPRSFRPSGSCRRFKSASSRLCRFACGAVILLKRSLSDFCSRNNNKKTRTPLASHLAETAESRFVAQLKRGALKIPCFRRGLTGATCCDFLSPYFSVSGVACDGFPVTNFFVTSGTPCP